MTLLARGGYASGPLALRALGGQKIGDGRPDLRHRIHQRAAQYGQFAIGRAREKRLLISAGRLRDGERANRVSGTAQCMRQIAAPATVAAADVAGEPGHDLLGLAVEELKKLGLQGPVAERLTGATDAQDRWGARDAANASPQTGRRRLGLANDA